MPHFNPFKSKQSGLPLTVPTAFRSWAAIVGELGCGGMQVGAVRQHKTDGTMSEETVQLALCEVYARAVMETAIGLHFDSVDSGVDQLVLSHIEELFSLDYARGIHETVRERGPVVHDTIDVAAAHVATLPVAAAARTCMGHRRMDNGNRCVYCDALLD